MLKQQLLLVGLLANTLFYTTQAFEFEYRPKRGIFADKKNANLSLSSQSYQFEIGTQKYPMKPKINLESGVTYVFGTTCVSGTNPCRKDPQPTPLYDTAKGAKVVKLNTFNLKFNDKALKGDVYSDDFKFDDFSINAKFGVIKSGDVSIEVDDTQVGLGLVADAGPDLPILYTDIIGAADEKGILVMNTDKAGDGRIIFGAVNDSACLNLFLVDAQKDEKSQQKWWIKFDKVESGKASEDNKLAMFDFSSEVIAMPKSLYDAVGADAVSDLSKLPSITFTLGGQKIVINPKDYTKPEGNKHRPLVASNDGNKPEFRLGSTFYKNRCISLSGDVGKYKIGISQWPEVPQTDGAGQVQLSVALIGFVSMLGLVRLF